MPAAGNPGRELPLEPITLSTIAITTHNLAWSPDAELALGCEDSVYIYLPEFTPPSANDFRSNYEPIPQYNEITLRFPTIEQRRPELNRPLFDTVGQEFRLFEHDPSLASAPITGMGGSLNHVAALEWSPCGLGRMKRSVLAVLTSGGSITVYCEGASDGMGSYKVRGRNTRTLRSWVVPWAVGEELLIPSAGAAGAIDRVDHITAFAWANDTGSSGALLAYANDDNEVVIVSVQARHRMDAEPGNAGEWRVEEIARFLAEGPHPAQDPTDPDCSPSGSSFSLSWSPWLNKGNSKSSIISYVARNYVGFRQVTFKIPWVHMETPKVDVAPFDSDGICLFLGPDAFVTWEGLVWTIDNKKVCRGLIATPARVQAFQLSFDADTSKSATRKHSIYDCNTAYPNPEESSQIANPITGLVVHPPSLSQTTSTPSFTLVRLSATNDNDNWHQTNLPLPPNPETQEREPRWATEIEQSVQHQLPRALAYQMVYNPENVEYEDDENDDELGGGAYGSDDDDDDLGNGDGDGDGDDIAGMRGLDTSDQVHTTRIRIWGLAASPGKGVTAVFVSPHSTLKPDRITFGGIKFKVLFGRHVLGVRGGNRDGGDDYDDDDAYLPPSALMMKNLSTEAKMWEWMYGGGPPVPGIESGADHTSDTPLKRKLAKVASSRICPFCGTRIRPDRGKASACANGHVFENCAATGIPILAPGVSNTCAVCGSKCLKPGELLAIAEIPGSDFGGGDLESIILEISPELCGGCGGKFIN